MALMARMANPTSSALPNEVMILSRPNESARDATPPSAEVTALTSAIARGDEAAFRTFYDRYQSRVFRFVIVQSRGDENLAQEIVQTVMLTAASKLKPLHSEEHLWNWLACVARQQLAKAWRRQSRNLECGNADELSELIETRDADCRLEEDLDTAMLSLDAGDRHVIELFYYQRLSCKEIAESMNSTAKAVSSRLERARAKLRLSVQRRLRHEP